MESRRLLLKSEDGIGSSRVEASPDPFCTNAQRAEDTKVHHSVVHHGPPLPKFRVKDDPAFTYTGVDFAGPLIARNGVFGNNVKVRICVFSCLVTRAVHLDITSDLSTETFLCCLKQFAARWGLPRK